jgi:hypothetical protein
MAMQNFQEEKGNAKPYQVKQLLKAIRYIKSNHPDYP